MPVDNETKRIEVTLTGKTLDEFERFRAWLVDRSKSQWADDTQVLKAAITTAARAIDDDPT